MSTIDIDTETGLAFRPVRRVEGAEEFRVRAWIELVTLYGEWLTNINSGIDYDAIFDGAEDAEIQADIVAKLTPLPGFNAFKTLPTITRIPSAEDEDGLNTMSILVEVYAYNVPITISVGTQL